MSRVLLRRRRRRAQDKEATMQSAAVKGFFIGGALGAALGLALGFARRGSEGQGAAESLVDLSHYPFLSKDGGLSASLHEPVSVFKTLDADGCALLLQAFDDLVHVYKLCREGESRPSLVSDALQARRAASNHLLALMRKARQRKPLEASDISEDVEALKRCLADYVYNIDQEQRLQQANVVVA